MAGRQTEEIIAWQLEQELPRKVYQLKKTERILAANNYLLSEKV